MRALHVFFTKNLSLTDNIIIPGGRKAVLTGVVGKTVYIIGLWGLPVPKSSGIKIGNPETVVNISEIQALKVNIISLIVI